MRRVDDVFFFVLVDFLIQVFFFGLLLYVVLQAKELEATKTKEADDAKVQEVVNWTGFSTLTELTDYLSKLAPPDDFRGWADFMRRWKDLARVEPAVELVDKNGGAQEVAAKLKKFEEAYGLPPCVADVRDGKRVPRAIAVIRLNDDDLEIQQGSPDFDRVLVRLGTSLAEVQRLSLADFRRRFLPLRQLEPTCRYFVDVEVRTKFLAPLDSVQSGFRIASRR